MPTDIVVHPLGIAAVRTYLLSRTEVTDLVGTRVGGSMPSSTATPRFPAVRLTELISTEVVPRRLMRMLVQVDCWAITQPTADHLGRVVIGALRASANFMIDGAVLGESQDLGVRSVPDTSVTPTQPRSIVTSHIYIRPDP